MVNFRRKPIELEEAPDVMKLILWSACFIAILIPHFMSKTSVLQFSIASCIAGELESFVSTFP